MKRYIIYKITNKINNKAYVGKTERTIEQRWATHCSTARQGSKFRFHSAIRKYGEDKWNLEILEEIITDNELLVNEKEMHYIALYKTLTEGYNAVPGGTGGYMMDRCSAEVYTAWKEKISNRTVGPLNPNYSGLTNDELVQIGIQFAEKYGFIGGKTRLVKFAKNELNVKFPKHFTNYRFGGDMNKFYSILEEKTGLKYNPYYRDQKQKQQIAEKASVNSTKMWETRRQQNASN